MSTENRSTYQFVVELNDFKPRMWRRFQISDTAGLQELCYAVMAMFHCMGGHLYQLRAGKRPTEIYYAPSNLDFDFDDYSKPLSDMTVMDVFVNENDTAVLEYDFGDGWEFKIKLEKIEPAKDADKQVFAKCLKGRGFGIIEDCGGAWGLMGIYDALSSGKCPEMFESIEDMYEWLDAVFPFEIDGITDGAFDYFDIDYVNELLKDKDELISEYEMYGDDF